MDEEKKEELKRQTLTAGDAEMDRGHKKKLGSKLVQPRDTNPGYNPFQEHQNNRNAWTVSNGSNPSQRFKSQIHRQNPKHKFHHKFGRNSNNGQNRHFGNYRQNFNRPNK